MKSYIEPQDLPTDGLKSLPAVMDVIRYGNINHDEKPEVIVVKESFFLRDKSGSRVGVFTRSAKDHSATVGDCRVLVNGDFIKGQATKDNNGNVLYNTSSRLGEHLGPFSSQFTPVNSSNSLLVHFTNPTNNRKYVFIVFEMVCTDFPPPLHVPLETRTADAFVGLHDRKVVKAGIKRFNKSTTEVDEMLIHAMKPRFLNRSINSTIFRGEMKNSILSNNLTVFKINLVGVG